MRLLEPFQIVHRHADVQIVGAGREDVFPGAGRLVRDDRVDRRVEEQRLKPREQVVERLAGSSGKRGARRCRGARGRGKRVGLHLSTNLRAVRLLCGPVFSQNSLV